MNKHLPSLLFSMLLLSGFNVTSQVKIGNNPGMINPNVVLELESTTNPFLPPRMTTAQRDAIAVPAEGMTIFNTTSQCNNTYQDGAWFDQCAFNRAMLGKQKINMLIGGNGPEQSFGMQQTTDGGYILVATCGSSLSGDVTDTNHGSEDYWVAKLDATGHVSWNKLLGGSLQETAAAIQQTADDGYIVAGHTNSSATGDISGTNHGGNSSEDLWIVKLDNKGTISWNKLLGGNNGEAANSIQQTIDGGYIIAGISNSSVSGDVSGTNHGGLTDMWVVKLDSNGNISWDKLIGGTGTERVNSILRTNDGGYIIAGASNSSGSGDITDLSHGGYDSWVVKLDQLGNISWNHLLGGNDQLSPEEFMSIQQTTDGGYIAAGYAGSSASGNVTGINHGLTDAWIVKLSNTGSVIWDKLLGGTQNEFAESVQQTIDGGYIIAGRSTSSNSGDVIGTNHGQYDIWIIKLDGNGNTTWSKLLGGSGSDEAFSIMQTVDGGYTVLSNSTSSMSGDVTATNHGSHDLWILKLDKLGNIIK